MKFRYIIFALIFLPFAEFAFFGVVSSKLGLFTSLILLVGLCFLGFYILKSQGRLLVSAMKSGEHVHITGESAKKGLNVALAALLFAFPGFLTDIAGLAMLIIGGRGLASSLTKTNTRYDKKNDGVIDLNPDEYKEKKTRKSRINSNLQP